MGLGGATAGAEILAQMLDGDWVPSISVHSFLILKEVCDAIRKGHAGSLHDIDIKGEESSGKQSLQDSLMNAAKAR